LNILFFIKIESTNIQVNDKNYIKTDIITNVNIKIVNLVLNTSVEAIVVALDNDNNFIYNERIKIEGEEYQNWGTDDNYLENLVLSKLGLSRKD